MLTPLGPVKSILIREVSLFQGVLISSFHCTLSAYPSCIAVMLLMCDCNHAHSKLSLLSTDPEEFLNMLFKRVLQVSPFISLR